MLSALNFEKIFVKNIINLSKSGKKRTFKNFNELFGSVCKNDTIIKQCLKSLSSNNVASSIIYEKVDNSSDVNVNYQHNSNNHNIRGSSSISKKCNIFHNTNRNTLNSLSENSDISNSNNNFDLNNIDNKKIASLQRLCRNDNDDSNKNSNNNSSNGYVINDNFNIPYIDMKCDDQNDDICNEMSCDNFGDDYTNNNKDNDFNSYYNKKTGNDYYNNYNKQYVNINYGRNCNMNNSFGQQSRKFSSWYKSNKEESLYEVIHKYI